MQPDFFLNVILPFFKVDFHHYNNLELFLQLPRTLFVVPNNSWPLTKLCHLKYFSISSKSISIIWTLNYFVSCQSTFIKNHRPPTFTVQKLTRFLQREQMREKKKRERKILEHPLGSQWIRESFFVPPSGFLRHIRQVRVRLRLKVDGSKFHFDFYPKDILESRKSLKLRPNPFLLSSCD